MRFARIVMLDFEEHDLEREDWDALRELAGELDRCRSSDPELPARLAGADCLLVQLGVRVTPELLEAAPRLRYVGVFGTSTGRVELAGRRDIAVRNVPGFSTGHTLPRGEIRDGGETPAARTDGRGMEARGRRERSGAKASASSTSTGRAARGLGSGS